jgi:hypothetical protein
LTPIIDSSIQGDVWPEFENDPINHNNVNITPYDTFLSDSQANSDILFLLPCTSIVPPEEDILAHALDGIFEDNFSLFFLNDCGNVNGDRICRSNPVNDDFRDISVHGVLDEVGVQAARLSAFIHGDMS